MGFFDDFDPSVDYVSLLNEGQSQGQPTSSSGFEPSRPFQGEGYEEEWSWNPLERMKASTEESVGSIFGMGAALADTLGFEGARDWAIGRAGDFFESAADRDIVRTDFASISNPMDAAKWAAETITGYVPDLAMMFVGGLGAGTAASKVAATAAGKKTTEVMLRKGFQKNLEDIVKKAGAKEATEDMIKAATKATARDAGALLGVASFEGSLGAGQSFLTDVEQRGADEASGIAALGTGAAQSLIAMFNPVNKVLAGKLPKGKTNVLQMTVGEAAEEAGQEVVSMAHEAGINPEVTFQELISSPDGRMRLLESGIAGALLGTTFGGGLRATIGRKPKETLEDTPTTTEDTPATITLRERLAQEKLKEAEKTVVLQAPEASLAKAGIDTSQDAEVPEMFKEVAAQPAPQEFTPERDIPRVEQGTPASYSTPEASRRIAAQEEINKVDWENLDTNDVPIEQPVKKTSRLKEAVEKRKAEKAATTQAAPMIKPLPTETKVETPKETQATKAKTTKVKAPSVAQVVQEENIKPEEAAKKEVKDVMTSTTPAVGDTGKITVREKVGLAEQQAIRESFQEAKSTKAGWKATKAKVDGKEITSYQKDNHVVVKSSTNKWIVASNEDGVRVNRGTFKSLNDATEAVQNDLNADEFYEQKTEKAYQKALDKKLTEEQATELAKVDPYEIAERAAAKMGISSTDPIETAVGAIYRAAAKWTPSRKNKEGKPVSLKNYVWTHAQGAIKDYYKDPENMAKREVALKSESTTEGSEKGEALENIADTEATEVVTESKKKRGRKTKEEQAKADAEKKQKEAEAKEKASEVKKISKEEYLKERAEREAKDKAEKEKRAEAANKEQVKEETPKEKEPVKAESTKDESPDTVETEAETLANSYSTKSKDSFQAVRKFLDDHPDDKNLTEVQKKAKELLIETRDLDESIKNKVSDKFPNALKLVEHAAENGNDRTSALSKFILGNVATRNKLRNVPILKSESGTNYYQDGFIYITSTNVPGETALHEAIHSFTVREMETNKALRDEVLKLMDTFKFRLKNDSSLKLFFTDAKIEEISKKKTSKKFKEAYGEKVSNQADGWDDRTHSLAYALLNEKEFLAMAFSDKHVQDFMRGINIDPEFQSKKGLRNLWASFVDLVRNALGLKDKAFTMLDRVLTISVELASTGTYSTKGSPSEMMEAPIKKKPEAKKTWDDRIKVLLEGDVRDKPLDRFKKWKTRAADTIRDMGKSMTEVVRKVAPKLLRPIRLMEQGINNKNVEYQRRVKPFIEAYRALSKEDKLILDLSLMNRHHDEYKRKSDEVLRRNNLEAAFRDVERVLEEIHFEKGKVGLNHYKDIPNYFPRRMEDVRGFLQYVKNDEDYGIIQAELDNILHSKHWAEFAEDYKKINGKKAYRGSKETEAAFQTWLASEGKSEITQKDKEEAITKMLNTGRYPSIALLDPTSSKERKIDKVSSEWVKFYHNTESALINHIYESNEAIYTRKFFGDINSKRLAEERDELLRKLENEKVKDRKGKVARLAEIEAYLDNEDKQFVNGISTIIAEMAPSMSAADQDVVIRAIRARLTQKGMSGPLASVRNLALMSALSSPTSAITQIGDLAFSIYRSGAANTVRSILGKKIITSQDLDLSHSMKEFQSEGSARWLDKTLKWSGLQMMDQFGKNTTMNAAIKRAQGMSFENFEKEFSYILQEDTKQTYEDLKEGKNTELTRFFAFNEISDFQPVSLSEMPIMYLTAGNGRIFYALKSFNIKAINAIYRESVHKWRTADNNADKMRAARDVGKLILLMTFAGASADELKDLLLGKDAGTFSDSVHENLLKIGLMSRYTLDQGFRSGDPLEVFLKDILIPPTGLVSDPFKDVMALIKGEPDLATIKNLPWGKIPYSWLSFKEEKSDMTNLRKEIMDDLKSGASISSVKPKVKKFNEWVREEKPEETKSINYGQLTKARKEYLKSS